MDANTLSAYVQNVFLKALEEPPRHACFILTATHTSELIPTVVSRCALIKLSGGGHDLAYVEEAAAILTPLSQKDELGVLRAVTALEKCDRADLREILEACRTLLRDSALHPLPPLSETTPQFRFTHAEFVSCADAIETARDGIERNLGVAIILGALCARLIRAMNAEEEQ